MDGTRSGGSRRCFLGEHVPRKHPGNHDGEACNKDEGGKCSDTTLTNQYAVPSIAINPSQPTCLAGPFPSCNAYPPRSHTVTL